MTVRVEQSYEVEQYEAEHEQEQQDDDWHFTWLQITCLPTTYEVEDNVHE